jgi:hypothetical protein
MLIQGPSARPPALHHARHLALVLLVATPLAFGVPGGPRIRFAVFGAIHAATVWASLRARPSLMRGLGFVTAAALTSAGAVQFGVLSARMSPELPTSALIAGCSTTGALAYGLLTRAIFPVHFPVGRLIATAAVCAIAALAAVRLAPGPGAFTLPSIAAAWWWVFSGGLCWADGIK